MICKYFLPFIRLHFHFLKFPLLIPGGSVVKNLPITQELQETWVQSLGQEYLLEESMATHAVLPRESPGQRRLEGYSSQGCKESDTTEVTQHSTAQKPFSLMQSHLLTFGFVTFAFWCQIQKSSSGLMTESLLLMFSNRSFSFRLYIPVHLELTFVCGFILLHVAVQFSQQQLLKRLSCLLCKFDHICLGLFPVSILFC